MAEFVGKSIYFATGVTFCSLYAAQPIQPLFQAEFQLSSFQAILFTTLMMAPLGVAPLFYGFLLEAISARKMVRWALFLLGVLEILFSFADNYITLLAIRAVQGFMIPAILTSLMSYISYSSGEERVQHAIASYIGATIAGGFLGRFLSGLLTDLYGWRFFFFLLGVLLIVCSVLLQTMVRDVKLNYVRPSPKEVVNILHQKTFLWLYATIFCLFFVFAAVMNYLPFELKAMCPQIGETSIGILYLGYSMGILVSLNSRRIIAWFGGEVDAIAAGIVLLAVGALLFLVQSYKVMFLAMFVFCAGLFTAHSLLSGYLSTLAKKNKAIANGLYICFYYTGGTLGSILPGVIYEAYGWHVFLSFLLIMIFVACVFTLFLKKAIVQKC
ncbi:MAG: MFS transporter [Desulfotalea sp.]|nr:MAG: MFS transporter [Desulfotalea sp.]